MVDLASKLRCVECDTLLNLDNALHAECDNPTNYYCQTCFGEMYSICHACNEYAITDDMTTAQDTGDLYCEDCANDLYTCSDCDDTVTEINLTVDNRTICQRCYENNYTTCEHCDEIVHCDNIQWIDETTLCDDCACEETTSCYECGDRHFDETMFSTQNGLVCEACYESDYSYCDTCGETCRSSEGEYDDNDNWQCANCVKNSRDIYALDYVFDYGLKPDPIFHRMPCDTLETIVYGIELEMEYEGASQSSVLSCLQDLNIDNTEKFWYAKHDGSLRHGLELVSNPATIAFWNDQRTTINSVLENVRSLGVRSYNTRSCGLHIHADKRRIGNRQLWKLLQFFANNKPLICAISQRKIDQLTACQTWDDLGVGTAEHNTHADRVLIAKQKRGHKRYCAINCSCRNTIEFRIFRGTLATIGVYRALQFVDAIIAFCAPCVVSPNNLTMQAFKDFVARNKRQYHDLDQWFNSGRI